MDKEPKIRVTMGDGSQWDVSAHVVADDRAKYYAMQESRSTAEYERIYRDEYDYTLGDDTELLDWAENNMNWDDVSKHAVMVSGGKHVDFEEGWTNGPKQVIR